MRVSFSPLKEYRELLGEMVLTWNLISSHYTGLTMQHPTLRIKKGRSTNDPEQTNQIDGKAHLPLEPTVCQLPEVSLLSIIKENDSYSFPVHTHSSNRIDN